MMDDLLTDPRLHSGVMAILVTAGGWFIRREMRRIDQAFMQSAKRDELHQLRLDLEQRHQENRGRLERIEGRVDELYRDMVNHRE